MKRPTRIIKSLVSAFILLMGLVCPLYAQEVQNQKVYIAIIIDDFGNQMAGTEEIAKLPIPLTGAVIPGMPFAKDDAKKLHDAGKEVILHVPLEPIKGKPNWLGPKGITSGMSSEKIRGVLEESMTEIPYAVGMNNHMGSRAMQSKNVVGTLMDFANEKGFYFVDSKTYDNKVAQEIATEKHTPYLVRDVFLDNTPSTGYVVERLNEAYKVAKEKGYAVVIGHVGPEKGPHTAAALKSMISQLQAKNVEFVTVSQLMRNLQGQ